MGFVQHPIFAVVNLGECYACTTKPERPIRLKFTGDVEKR